MNRWSSGLVMVFLVSLAACVDTAEPTGPVPQPTPPEDPGDFVPSLVGANPAAAAAGASAGTVRSKKAPGHTRD